MNTAVRAGGGGGGFCNVWEGGDCVSTKQGRGSWVVGGAEMGMEGGGGFLEGCCLFWWTSKEQSGTESTFPEGVLETPGAAILSLSVSVSTVPTSKEERS